MRRFISQKVITACCLLLVVLVGTRLVFFARFSDALEYQIETGITAIVDSKKAVIESLVAGYRSDAQILTQRRVVIQALESARARQGASPNLDLEEVISQTVKAYGFHNVVVFGQNLEVVGAYRRDLAIDPDFSALRSVMAGRDPALIDLHFSRDGRPVFGIAAPVPGSGELASLGLVYVEVDAANKLYPLIGEWPREALSAETLLLRPSGDEVVYLSPLRFRPDQKPVETRLHSDDPERIDLVQPQQGKTLFLAGKDYRGMSVYGALAAIEGTNWVILAKMNQDELRRPIVFLRNLTLFGALVVALLLIFVGRLLWRSQVDREDEARSVIEENYNALVKASIDAYFALDNTGTIIDFNDAFLELTGSLSTALHMQKLHAVNKAYSSELCDQLMVILRLNATAQMVIPWRCEDDRLINVLISGVHVGTGDTPLKERFHFFIRQQG